METAARAQLKRWPILVGAGFCALVYGVLTSGRTDANVPAALLKFFSVQILALAAFSFGSFDAVGQRVFPPPHNKLLAAGLFFGAFGDLFLAMGPRTFLAGAFAFLIGHLFYITLFLRAGLGVDALRTPWRIAAMIAVFVAAVVMASLLGAPRESPLFTPLSIYTAVLSLMTLTSFTLPASRWPVMLGAVLFFISDGFVAAHMFHPIADSALAYWSSFAGWMLYWAGQAAICVGALGLHKPQAA